jgi:hypothetical protein
MKRRDSQFASLVGAWVGGAALVATGILAVRALGDVPEDGFRIARSTIDGGGNVRCSGGNFELSGTIGQPDAGVLAGGDFELTGGFWFCLAPGDGNEDGAVNLDDYEDFLTCMTGPEGMHDGGCEAFDVDQNESIDLYDFAVVQTTFTGH